MPPTIHPVAVEEALDGLPNDALHALAVLYNAPDGVAELTLVGLPYGSRSALKSYGAIETNASSAEEVAEVRVTPFGQQLIEAARNRVDPAGSLAKVAELEERVRSLLQTDAAQSQALS
jgi:hypothetical protein